MTQPAPATQILSDLCRGDQSAADRLAPLVYQELRTLAAGYMRQERANHTLQPTALVNEAYLRMIDQPEVDWKNRAHFFAVAAQMIRRILIDHAREKATAKRGGGAARVDLETSMVGVDSDILDLVALNEALDELARLNDRHRKVVELRYFGGLTLEEVGEVLDVSPETVKTDWRSARAWLRTRLEASD